MQMTVLLSNPLNALNTSGHAGEKRGVAGLLLGMPNNVNQPCVYIHSLPLSLPSSLIPASRSSRSTALCSLSSTAASHLLCSLHLTVCKCQTNVPIHLSLPFPLCIHTSILYVCLGFPCGSAGKESTCNV